MKQLLQSLKDGSTLIENVPVPKPAEGQLLLRTRNSLVSAGTERMLVKFGKGNLLEKAAQHPDKVRAVVEKAKTDGVLAAYDAVQSKLSQLVELGYCNVGEVEQSDTPSYPVGQRVVSNGKHAEFVVVSKNLCAAIPDNVSDEEASFTVVGAIGLQGIRLAEPTLGEVFVVIGLGLIGLMTIQMLAANGCRVIGLDIDKERVELAKTFGVESFHFDDRHQIETEIHGITQGHGADGVLITAATDSNEPIDFAAKISRKHGRIILVGVSGLNLSRDAFYEKELVFRVSCSYGPGRYDPNYEEQNNDYPYGYVRWTEQRNFQAVLSMMSSGALDVKPLISHRYAISEADKAMNLLASSEKSLGIVIEYNADQSGRAARVLVKEANWRTDELGTVGSIALLGSGNYASRVLAPAFKSAGANLHTVVSNQGVSAVHVAKKFGFSEASNDAIASIESQNIDTVVIATHHHTHADFVISALKNGKNVFCEKPLCLTESELDEIRTEYKRSPNRYLMVGFNRRFAPQIIEMKRLLENQSLPKNFIMTVNAGAIPEDHWTQNRKIGGERIIGEACHFVDLLYYLAGSEIVDARIDTLGNHPAIGVRSDKAVIVLRFLDGSVGVINYLANGHAALPKERIEVFCDGRVLQLDNFIRLKAYGWSGVKHRKLYQQDKGQKKCISLFMKTLKSAGAPPIKPEEIFHSMSVSLQLAELATK